MFAATSEFPAGGVPSRWRTLTLLSVASAAWAFGFGLSLPLGSLWLRDAGYSYQLIGLTTSIYYLGVAVASLCLPFLLRRTTRLLVSAGMVIDGLTIALFPWTGFWPAVFALRLCSGLATAVCLIPLETLVNQNAPADSRARDFSIYALSVALGLGLGALIGLPLYPVAPQLAFLLAGGVVFLGAGLLWWGFPPGGLLEEQLLTDVFLSVRELVLSLGTSWLQGFMEGGVLTFLSDYLLKTLGYSSTAVSGLMGAMFLGVVLVQLPGAWLADSLGRLRVVLACHAILLAGLLCLPFCLGPVALGSWLFVLGAACAGLYPLGLALLGERVAPASLARASSWYLACNCLGSLLGPWVMGRMIDWLGPRAIFGSSILALLLVLAVWSLFGKRRRVDNGRSRPAQAAAVLLRRAA